MKKITFLKKRLCFIYILVSLFTANVFAQSWVEDVYVYDDFGTTGGTTSGNWVDGTLTQGYWTGAVQSTANSFTSAINTTNKNVEIKTNVKIGNFVNNIKTFSGTGAPYSSPSGKITVSFICKIGGAQTYSGAYFYFRDNNNKPILGLGFARINSGGNKWLAVGPISYTEWVTGATSNYANITTPALLPTAVDAPALKVTAVLDFTTHKYSLTAVAGAYTPNANPEWSEGANKYTNTSVDFLDNTASNIANILFEANGLQSSGSATATNFTFDNFKIAGERLASTSTVTINYKDQLGNTLKTSRVQTDVPVGSIYTATASDKATFKDASNYCVYDAASSTDNVVVASGGSVIDLHFKVVPITDGTYTWTGTANGNWDELNANFTTDGTNSLGYQVGNALIFPEVATTKTVTLGKSFDLGAGNMTISADGYTFGGTGSLTGTGTVYANPGASGTTNLSVVNSLTGGINVQSGTFKINVADAGSSFTMANGTTLNVNSGANFSKAIAGTGTMTLIPTSNVSYSSTISGLSAINYVLTSAGAASTSGAFSLLPTLNNTFDGAINVSTSLSSSSMYGSTNNFTNNVLTLGDNVTMVYPINPASDGTTAIAIGELSGTSLSKLMGPRLRTVNYNIGGLNTNSTFAGTVENFPADNWSNIPVINISKVGTGVLTLTGTSSGYVAGTISASAGTLIVNGQLGTTAVPATVATGATLKGTGTIGGATTVNGTLEGSMNFGSTLTLAGTTKINVSGFNAGDYDQIKVTGALTNGGVLNINITSDPTGTGTIQLINAGSYSGTFTSVNIVSPSHPAPAPAQNRVSSANYATITYSYDASTGILSYTDVPTNVNTLHSDLQIYPTLSKGNVYVNAENVNSISVVSMSGQLMQQVNSTGNRTTVNLNGLSNGSYILNVKFNDGLNKTQSVILQK